MKMSSKFCNIFLLVSSVINLVKAKAPLPIVEKIRCEPGGACYCPEDPLTDKYSDHEDPTCEHYYLCHLGRAFKKKCDVRTAFHPLVGECMPRQRIPEKYCAYPVVCPLWLNRYMEDPEDCTKYYLCFYQKPSHYGCPEGHYFDPDKEKCIHDSHQAEICHDQALLNKGQRLNVQSAPVKTSHALNKANTLASNATIQRIPKAPKKPLSNSKSMGRSFSQAIRG